jgi:hypothetical protein
VRAGADDAPTPTRDARVVQTLTLSRVRRRRRSRAARLLLGLAAFNALDAAIGGIGLATGAISVGDTLEGSPFSTPTIPGLILLVAVGGSMAVAAAALWRRDARAHLLAACAGLVQVGWIVVQVALLGLTSFLQPAILLLGLATTALAARRPR